MAANSLFRLLPAALRLLHLRSIKESRDNRRRADTDRDAGLYKLATPFVVTLRLVAHLFLALTGRHRSYDGGRPKKSAKGSPCAAA